MAANFGFSLFLFLFFSRVYKAENVQRSPDEIQKLINKIQTPGLWTSWGSWMCDGICGKGQYFRKRRCLAKEEFGIPMCQEGESVERSNKDCDVPCQGIEKLKQWFMGPQLSTSFRQLLEVYQTTTNYAYERHVGETVQLNCSNVLTVEVLTNHSRSSLFWEKNGDQLQYDFGRMMLREYSILEIGDLRVSDTGVYSCKLRFSRSLKRTVLWFSLIVLGNPYQLHVSSSDDVTVTCNSKAIAEVIETGLNVQWLVNESRRVLKDYRSMSSRHLQEMNSDVISDLQAQFTGLWLCVVRDTIHNRTWMTNALYVKVRPNLLMASWNSLNLLGKLILLTAAMLIGLACAVLAWQAAVKSTRKRKAKLQEELFSILKVCREVQMKEQGKESQKLPRTNETEKLSHDTFVPDSSLLITETARPEEKTLGDVTSSDQILARRFTTKRQKVTLID